MPTLFTSNSEKAVEKSSYILTLTFKDSRGNEVAPTSVKWSLVDRDGDYINSRQDVPEGDLSSVMDIELNNLDLAMSTSYAEEYRWLVVEATYDDENGVEKNLNDQCRFTIQDLKKIS